MGRRQRQHRRSAENAAPNTTAPTTRGRLPQWLRSLTLGLAFATAAAFATGCAPQIAAPDLPAQTATSVTSAEQAPTLFLGAQLAPPRAGGPYRFKLDEVSSRQLQSYQERAKILDAQIEACRQKPQDFSPRFALWVKGMDALQKCDDPLLVVETVQALFNLSLTFDKEKEKDKKWANVPDWIMTPADLAQRGMGTCGDLTMGEYEWLGRLLGKEKVWFVSGMTIDPQTKHLQPHAVCVVQVKERYYALDHANTESFDALTKNASLAQFQKTIAPLSFVEDTSSYLDPTGKGEGIKMHTAKGLFIPLFVAHGDNLKDIQEFQNIKEIPYFSENGLVYTPVEKGSPPKETYATHQARWNEMLEKQTNPEIVEVVVTALSLNPALSPPAPYYPVGSAKHGQEASTQTRPPAVSQPSGFSARANNHS